MSAVLPVRVGFTRPTTVYDVPLMGSDAPTAIDFFVAYAVLTSTSFAGEAENHAPVATWARVTRPASGDAGSTPATVYLELVVSVVGGLTTCEIVRSGVTTVALNSWKRA